MPSENKYYLYVTTETFKTHICHWLSFADCYIGCATVDDGSFAALRRQTLIENKSGTSPTGADIHKIPMSIDSDLAETQNEFQDS